MFEGIRDLEEKLNYLLVVTFDLNISLEIG
jgi:hypothetical protein